MASKTPLQYAKDCLNSGTFASMTIISLCGKFYIGDNDFNLLNSKTYNSRDAANNDRSKIIDKAIRAYNK